MYGTLLGVSNRETVESLPSSLLQCVQILFFSSSTMWKGGVPPAFAAIPCCRYTLTHPGQRGMAKPCQIAAVVVEAPPAGEVSSPFDDRQSL